MKHIILLTLLMLLCVLTVSCATMRPTTEPDAAVAKYKAVDAYVLIPRKAEDQESTAATITGDDSKIRWVPLKIKVNVPVDEGNVPEKTDAPVEEKGASDGKDSE